MKAKFIKTRYGEGSNYYHCSIEESVKYNEIYEVEQQNRRDGIKCYGVRMNCGKLLSFPESYWEICEK